MRGKKRGVSAEAFYNTTMDAYSNNSVLVSSHLSTSKENYMTANIHPRKREMFFLTPLRAKSKIFKPKTTFDKQWVRVMVAIVIIIVISSNYGGTLYYLSTSRISLIYHKTNMDDVFT